MVCVCNALFKSTDPSECFVLILVTFNYSHIHTFLHLRQHVRCDQLIRSDCPLLIHLHTDNHTFGNNLGFNIWPKEMLNECDLVATYFDLPSLIQDYKRHIPLELTVNTIQALCVTI